MTTSLAYNEVISNLASIYLEDSWVLDITKNDDTVSFDMEFVLTEDHELYHSPKPNEQYCYKKGQLIFSSCSSIFLQLSNQKPSIDANGETDLGNIDSFTIMDEHFTLEGDWGTLEAECANVGLKFAHKGPSA